MVGVVGVCCDGGLCLGGWLDGWMRGWDSGGGF